MNISFDFIQQLLPLQVVIPMLAAPLCALVASNRLAWLIASLAAWSAFAIAILLHCQVAYSGPISYAMGHWLPPIGIQYKIDSFNSFILVIISSVGALLMPFAYKSIQSEVAESKQPYFYTVYLLCLSGLLGITITNDAFNIYVFLEISSLATYTLIAQGKHRKALLSGIEYLILGSIGATFYLIGIGLLYMATGTLNITDLSERIQQLDDISMLVVAFTFITIGLALKIALYPLHLWLCNAYTYAPSFVSAFLSATATKVSLYVLIRYIFVVFGMNFSFEILPLGHILMTLSVLAIFLGSLFAIYQDNIKSSLAYSSVAQIGYITLGISLASHTGLTAAILHMFNHAIMKSGLFIACGCVFYRFGSVSLSSFQGLGKLMPNTMLAFVICGLSLVGVPFTAGFISKWYLLLALIEQDLWLLVALLLFSSLLALIYIWRVVEVAYFQPPPPNAASITKAPLLMRVSVWVCALASLYFGLDTSFSLESASQAATLLIGGKV